MEFAAIVVVKGLKQGLPFQNKPGINRDPSFFMTTTRWKKKKRVMNMYNKKLKK